MSLVVVGDALLDRDLTGTVDRLCPDAPVPVVDAPEVTTMIAWPPQSTSRALAALVRTATGL